MTDTPPDNGKRNGNGRDAKGQFAAGNKLGNRLLPGHAPVKRTRPLTFMDHLRTALSETVTRKDGRRVPKDQAIAEMLVNRTIKSLTPDASGNPREWDKAADHVLNRISPIPRDPVLVAERQTTQLIEVNEHAVQVGFIDKIRVFADTQAPTDQDVLDFLDHDISQHIDPS